MDYQIVGFEEGIGQIVVRYSQGDVVADYAIDVPVRDGAFIAGDELDSEIRSRAPVWLVQRKAEVSAADFSHIKALADSQVSPAESQTLDGAKLAAEFAIDGQAGETRKRFVTVTAMQSTVYYIKAEQAKAFKDAGYQGVAPPYIAQSAAALGKTAQEIADEILYLHDQWVNVIDPVIEAKRIAGKKAVGECTTIDGVKAAQAAAVSELMSITPLP